MQELFYISINGGGGIRNPKVVVTPSEQATDKTPTETLQNGTTNTFTECPIKHNQTDSLQDCNTTLHKKCAICVHHLNSDLEEIARIWPELPEHIKAAIRALVQTHIKEQKQ